MTRLELTDAEVRNVINALALIRERGGRAYSQTLKAFERALTSHHMDGIGRHSPANAGRRLVVTLGGQDTASVTLTYAEAAQAIGVHPDTIGRWVRAGRLPSTRSPGGRRAIPASAVTSYLEERRS